MAVSQKSPLDDPYPSTTPDLVDVAAHLAVQPSVKLCTTRRGLPAVRASRQHAPTAADAADTDKANSTLKMSKSWNEDAQSALKRDGPASSRRKTNIQAQDMR